MEGYTEYAVEAYNTKDDSFEFQVDVYMDLDDAIECMNGLDPLDETLYYGILSIERDSNGNEVGVNRIVL